MMLLEISTVLYILIAVGCALVGAGVCYVIFRYSSASILKKAEEEAAAKAKAEEEAKAKEEKEQKEREQRRMVAKAHLQCQQDVESLFNN